DEVHALFAQKETDDRADKESNEKTIDNTDKPSVVAVTACPTGIAHTYMAEDTLKKQPTEMNVDIRVETNQSDGAKNVLTKEEIKQATGVILAADTNVEMARFDQKPVLQRPVSEGINKSKELITKAIHQDAPIYHAQAEDHSANQETEATGSIWRKIYKDLMNGVSYMLPFVVGGGILM